MIVEKIQRDREQRRKSAQHRKAEKARADDALISAASGPSNLIPGGVAGSGVRVDKATLEFMRMISSYREEHKGEISQHSRPEEHSICVVVRKRPQSKKEASTGDYDAVTTLNPRVVVHAPKLKVDGITKYLENTTFQFDHTFSEHDTTEDVYRYTVMPLVAYAFQKRGRGTCFAYGQTGSGKTYTMSGIQELVARDVFRALNSNAFKGKGLTVHASFFEIYGGRAFDVLHGRQMLQIRENEKQQVVVVGLQEVACSDEAALLDVISRGNSSRTTHSTEVNEGSSRSHAICEVSLRTRDSGKVHGSLSLIDLAGSERAADSKNHNQQRRIESAEINKSLLGLKECIRALAVRAAMAINTPEGTDLPHVHVPFRASKLTLALRDSFVSPNARVVMIATVSPNASGWDHTGNTLRYADRVKEQPTDLMGLGEGVGKGGGGGREITFSFLESDRGNASGMPSRVSPLTTDGQTGSGSGGSNNIVEARAPPRPIFQRMKGVGGTANSAEPSSFDVAKGVAPRSRVSRSSLNSGSDSGWSGKEGDEDEDEIQAPVARGGARRVLVQSQAQAERKVADENVNDEEDDDNEDDRGQRFVTKMNAPNPSRSSSGAATKLHGRKSIQSSSSSLDDSLESDGAGKPIAAVSSSKAPVPRQGNNGSSNPVTVQPSLRLIPEIAAAAQQIPGNGFKRLLQLGVGESLSSQGPSIPPPPPPPPPSLPSNVISQSDILIEESIAQVSSVPPLPRNNAKDKLREKGRKAAAAQSAQSSASSKSVAAGRTTTTVRSSDIISDIPTSSIYPSSSGAVVTRSMSSQQTSSGLLSQNPTALKPPPMSPEKRDLQLLHETLKREAKGSFKDLGAQQITEQEQDLELEFHEAVGIIYDEEQDLYNAHTSAITENSEVIEAESKLLVWMQSGEPDVDIGLYSARLRGLLERKIETAQRLMEKVISLQTHLAIEAEVSEARQNKR